MAGKLAASDGAMMKLPREQFAKVIDGLVWGVFFHELGHAVIHISRVPVTGREEDVADQFAAWYAMNFLDLNRTPVITPTIWLWMRMAKTRDIPTMSDEQRKAFLANEHSLDEQRVYNIACLALGFRSEGERGPQSSRSCPKNARSVVPPSTHKPTSRCKSCSNATSRSIRYEGGGDCRGRARRREYNCRWAQEARAQDEGGDRRSTVTRLSPDCHRDGILPNSAKQQRDYEKRRPSQIQCLCGLAGGERLVRKKVCYETVLLLFL